MANGNLLVNALRGALTPLAVDKQRQQQLEDELLKQNETFRLQQLLEAFRQQAAGDRQKGSQDAAMARIERTAVLNEEAARTGRGEALAREVAGLGLPGTGGLSSAFAEHGPQADLFDALAESVAAAQTRDDARSEAAAAPGLARQRVIDESNLATSEARQGLIEAQTNALRNPQPKPPKLEKVAKFDGFKDEVDQEQTSISGIPAMQNLSPSQTRLMAIERVVVRNGGDLARVNISEDERSVHTQYLNSISGDRQGTDTGDDIIARVTGEKPAGRGGSPTRGSFGIDLSPPPSARAPRNLAEQLQQERASDVTQSDSFLSLPAEIRARLLPQLRRLRDPGEAQARINEILNVLTTSGVDAALKAI